MRTTKLLGMLFGILLLGALLPGATFASTPASDVFFGNALSGVGQASPVDINPTDVTVRPADGAVGIGYAYRAAGQAYGEVPGAFEYLERGYLFFKNPADPTTFLGGQYTSGTFKLTPRDVHYAPISIVDADPSAYRSGVSTLPLPGAASHGSAAYASGLQRLGLLAPGRNGLTVGYFTFTDRYGARTGYATPDFRTFSIRLVFDV